MICIRVPATSANMGPGFDCLGVALDLYNYYEIEETAGGLEIIGCEECYSDEHNLIYTSMLKCFEVLNHQPSGLRIRINSSIPISRGLGSSAACIIGGIVAANELAGGKLTKAQLLEIANEIEGHPDNVAPALLGGMLIAVQDQGKVHCDKIKLVTNLRFCALIPNFTLSTKEARAVLPDKLTYGDAIFNISRASLMVTALANGSHDLIKHACEDALHQPYRSKLIPGYEEIVQKSKELGCLGVFLSGAGPTIMVLLQDGNNEFTVHMQGFLDTMQNKWSIKELNIDNEGMIVTKTRD
ncbi:MAG: homoserine kinase [Clostridiales bacterium GWB2_37_7]|nr:MAG: homoserine kinase [Clostridiales bacterium GWB2_37_7]